MENQVKQAEVRIVSATGWYELVIRDGYMTMHCLEMTKGELEQLAYDIIELCDMDFSGWSNT